MKNLICFDLETTGLNKDIDHIIQFSACKYNPETNKIIASKNLYIQPEGQYSISIQAWIKHGITSDFLKDKPFFKNVADEIISFFDSPDNYDILTYNGNSFDIPFLLTELNRIGKHIDFLKYNVYDAYIEERKRNGINLPTTFQRYYGTTMEECGLTSHNALSDVKATIGIFKAQQKVKEYSPNNLLCEDNFLINSTFNNENKICFNFGKYASLPVEWVYKIDADYIKWCLLDKTNFSSTTKDLIRKITKL